MSSQLQHIGNYRLIRFLGSGGCAEVYLGEHIYLRRLAAIKVLQARLGQAGIESFLNEARIIASLEHPHIVRVLDYAVERSTPFLVMIYAPKGSLHQHHPRGLPLSPTLALSYVKQVASALQYAHDSRLIHCDVKPHNMLLGANNEVLLSDFGLASLDHRTQSLIMRPRAGTPAYMAPEQFQGKARAASDQYSLGIVVYQWLCGQLPFLQGEMQFQHTLVPPPPLHEKLAAISPAVEQVVLKALAKDPHQRFGCVKEFAEALEQAYLSEPYLLPSSPAVLSASLPAGSTIPLDSFPDGQAGKGFSGAFVSASSSSSLLSQQPANGSQGLHPVPATGIAAEISRSEPPPFPLQTPMPSSPVAPQHSHPHFPATLPPAQPEHLAPAPYFASPTGSPPSQAADRPKRNISRRRLVQGLIASGIAVALSGKATPLSDLRSPSRTVGRLRPLPGKLPAQTAPPTIPVGSPILIYRASQGDVKSVSWSSDGQRIASVGGKTVEVWNSTTGKSVLSSPYGRHTLPLKSVCWSPDGQHIASGGEDDSVRIWDAATGGDLFFSPYKKHTGFVRGVAWSPDGQYIASASEDRSVRVWEASTGKDRFFSPYTGHSDWVITAAWSPDVTRIASASFDRSVRVWDASSGQDFFQLVHTNSVRAVAWSPDGKYIASGGDDQQVHLWDARTGKLFGTYSGHRGAVQAVAWSSDSQYLASASFDKTVKVWQATSGADLLTYRHHTDAVWSVGWSPLGHLIASGAVGEDNTVQIWKPV